MELAGDEPGVILDLDDLELALGRPLSIEVAPRSQIEAILERGIADGSIAPCDVRMTGNAIMGALNWIPKWHHGDEAVARRLDQFTAFGRSSIRCNLGRVIRRRRQQVAIRARPTASESIIHRGKSTLTRLCS